MECSFTIDGITYNNIAVTNPSLYNMMVKHHTTKNIKVCLCKIKGNINNISVVYDQPLLSQLPRGDPGTVNVYFFNGVSIKNTDTALTLDMDNGNIIDVAIHHVPKL